MGSLTPTPISKKFFSLCKLFFSFFCYETTQIPNLAIFAPIFLKFSLKVQFFVLNQPIKKNYFKKFFFFMKIIFFFFFVTKLRKFLTWPFLHLFFEIFPQSTVPC